MLAEIFNYLIKIISQFGYYGVFFGMLLESACIPIPSEIIMPLAGFLAFQGTMNFWIAVIIATLASIAGSLIAYYVGLKGGRPFLEKNRIISKHDLKKTDAFFEKYSIESVFIGRFVPVVRTFISLPAGVARADLKKFTVYTAIGTFFWNLALAFAGLKLGQNWLLVYNSFHYLDIIVIVVALVLLSYFSLKKLKVIK
jgi:membrane protein DedA with SNARE-associated domain